MIQLFLCLQVALVSTIHVYEEQARARLVAVSPVQVIAQI